MSFYGASFYGISTYGLDDSTGISIEPFTAVPTDFNNLFVSFTLPTYSTTWLQGKMLRSRAGWSTDVNDGTVVWQAPAGSFVKAYTDSNLVGGSYYYYTLWIQKADSTWVRAGRCSGLAIADSGITDVMWNRIPKYFRWVRPGTIATTDSYMVNTQVAKIYDPTAFDVENPILKKFVKVLGWGEDIVRNYQQTLAYLNDPRTMHVADLTNLAQQMGIEYEPAIPGQVMRSKVLNAGILAKERGTLEGLEDVASLSSGWACDVAISQNIFLSRESSEFLNPQFPLWDSTTNYPPGVTVSYLGYLWTSTQAAVGKTMSPPSTGTSNTWWTQVNDTSVSSVQSAPASVAANGTLTGSLVNQYYQWVRTWSVDINGTINGAGAIQLSTAVTSAFDQTKQTYNSLRLSNTTGSTYTIFTVGAGGNPTGTATALSGTVFPVTDKYTAMTQGIPLPRAGAYDPTHNYQIGDYCIEQGMLFQANADIVGVDPVMNPASWTKVGFDERPILAYSFYTHSTTTGASGTGYNTNPTVTFHDAYGNVISQPQGPEDCLYDSFNSGFSLFGDHTIDVGLISTSNPTPAWSNDSGNMKLWRDSTNSVPAVYSDQFVHGTTNLISVTYQVSDVMTTNQTYNVAAQFVEDTGGTGMHDGLAIHITDKNNFTLFARDGIYKMSSGTLTKVFTYKVPVKNYDRMRITLDKASGSSWSLYVNENLVTTGAASGVTMTVPSGVIHHGLAGVPA